jgi:hypothetical protein
MDDDFQLEADGFDGWLQPADYEENNVGAQLPRFDDFEFDPALPPPWFRYFDSLPELRVFWEGQEF